MKRLKPKTVERDGIVFEVHSVAIDNGQTPIGSIEAPSPNNLSDLSLLIDKGIETEASIAALYKTAKIVSLQAQLRRAHLGGKVPQSFVAKIYQSITAEQQQSFRDTGNGYKAMQQYIAEQWKSTLVNNDNLASAD